MCLTTSVRDEREMGTKWSNTGDNGVVAGWSGMMLLHNALTDFTLSTKKHKKSSHVETVASDRGLMRGLTTELIVLNNTRGQCPLVEIISDRYWDLASFTAL